MVNEPRSGAIHASKYSDSSRDRVCRCTACIASRIVAGVVRCFGRGASPSIQVRVLFCAGNLMSCLAYWHVHGRRAHASWIRQLCGQPIIATRRRNSRESGPISRRVVPCGHCKWICATLAKYYEGDERHDLYRPVWAEMQAESCATDGCDSGQHHSAPNIILRPVS